MRIYTKVIAQNKIICHHLAQQHSIVTKQHNSVLQNYLIFAPRQRKFQKKKKIYGCAIQNSLP